jgi:hypothetical protein
VGDQARMTVEDSAVGALRLAAKRPDLATSQVRVSGHGQLTFSRVRFDCGIVAADDSLVEILRPLKAPAYVRHSGRATIRTDAPSVTH